MQTNSKPKGLTFPNVFNVAPVFFMKFLYLQENLSFTIITSCSLKLYLEVTLVVKQSCRLKLVT